jgi:broad specificity phosphatase PhoE
VLADATRIGHSVRVPPPAPCRCEHRSVTVTFVRHGRAEFAEGRRFKGHGIDLTPLSPDGVAEAEAAGRALAMGPPDLILSSPMTRALQTAMIISWHVDRRVVVEMDLHEWMPDDKQQWQDGAVPDSAAREMKACGGEWPSGQIRSWEPLSAVRQRVNAVFGRYLDIADLAVVCHSVVIEAMTGVSGSGHCERVPFHRP